MKQADKNDIQNGWRNCLKAIALIVVAFWSWVNVMGNPKNQSVVKSLNWISKESFACELMELFSILEGFLWFSW